MKTTGCYILYSEKVNKYYVGVCQEDIEKRIFFHNISYYGKTTFTKIANDWELKLFIETEDYARAVRIERKIKKMKSRIYIENLLKYPELILKLK